MRKIKVELSAILPEHNYVWYKVVKKMLGIELRGKERDFRPGDVIGLRKSTDGKSTRMVLRDKINVVMSPSKQQTDYILSKVEPLIGGPVDKSRIGAIDAPKAGIKERRINDELEEIQSILMRGPEIDKLRVLNKRLYFTYKGRRYGVVSDPS